MAAPSPPRPASPQAVRYLGRFQLLRLLSKTERTMAWRVEDPRVGQEWVLMLPRNPPANAGALQRWLDNARQAARIEHPGLAHAVEVGEHERWPYVAYDLGNAVTVAERLGGSGVPATELVPLALQALQGLAFAHEAGVAHQDLQLGALSLGETGCRLMGLGVALPPEGEPPGLPALHRACERDLLAFGLVLHHALAGAPALETVDVGLAISRMPPQGREIVRLPWIGTRPIPDALRAIVNRATDRQPRQRYRSARTLERALEGWQRADGASGGGAITLLLDRMHAAGLLPAMPGGAARAARLASMEHGRTIELAGIVLQDLGLCCELLRMANGSRQRGALGGGNGAVLTVRRAIAMLGVDGVRRAALSLRAWPGPLADAPAAELAALIDRVALAGRVAQWLRPSGYDDEVVYVLTVLQNLGRLVVQYHFPEEAAQIRRLMQPAPPPRSGEPEEPGMVEEAAAFAVLGVDIDELGVAVGHHWGLEEHVLQMICRISQRAPVHPPDSDAETLRLIASCANDVVDARAMPQHHRAAYLQRVVQRYGRPLGLTPRDVLLAAQGVDPNQAEALDKGEVPVDGRPARFGALS